MPQSIQDNQYREAPQGPPIYMGGENEPKMELQGTLKDYHDNLVNRVIIKDPSLTTRTDLVATVDGQLEWKKSRVVDQPTNVLRDMLTIIENTENLIKANLGHLL